MYPPTYRYLGRMRSSVIVGLSLLLTSRTVAQNSSVTCNPSFAWANNNLGQSPCVIAAYIRSACETNPADYNIVPSLSGHYGPPTGTDVDICTCSMVYYNTINACSVCAGNKTLSWSASTAPCGSKTSIARVIPDGTAVPAWAFLDVTQSGNVFNATQAQDYSTRNNTMVTASGLAQPSGTGSPSAHKSNTGAIVGGVVAGVTAMIAIVSALIFWRRRRGRARGQTLSVRQSTMVEASEAGLLSHAASPNPDAVGRVGKLYNPDDPSTFPDALSPPTMRFIEPTNVGARSEAGTSERTVVAEL
ncbi:hypothetical protein PsYK624_069450 [Phanerochaete sordida]|uniref:Uncharacterized protein n=1 Tax=Phanerochaete sordida TaxID=48140 RepID=A0A9P3G9J9_9APHY|nr:hypothetical protein PsYK624_069450 [Phanerochaete sordida]